MLHLPELSRVLFVDVNSFIEEGFTNGATILYREIFRRFSIRGVHCRVCTFSPRPAEEIPPRRQMHVIDNVYTSEYVIDSRASVASMLTTIRRGLKDFPADLILVNTPPNRLDECELLLFEAIAAEQLRVLCFVPDDHFPRSSTVIAERYARFIRCLASCSLTAPSLYIARQVQDEYGLPVTIFPNLFTPEDIRVADTQPSQRAYITLINPHPLKGISLFEELARRLPHLPFLVVRGWPYPPRYRSSVPNIRVLPFQRDMRRVWGMTKLLVVPSLCHEGFGRVVIEAMLNGIPVVAHKVGGIPEAASDAAVLISPPPFSGTREHPSVAPEEHGPAALKLLEAVEDLIGDDESYSRLAIRAYQQAGTYISRAEDSFAKFFPSKALVVMPPRAAHALLLLSPHSDDIAFSIGGILTRRAFRGRVYLVTVFGRSNYFANSGFHQDATLVTAQRQEEDSHFARLLGLDHRYYHFPEASLRIGSSYEAVFSDTVEYSEVPSPELERSLLELVWSVQPSHIILPLGLGRHKDHILVRDLGRSLAEKEGIETVFYEDLPYAAGLDERNLVAQASKILGERCVSALVHLNGGLPQKRHLVRRYRSQVSVDTVAAITRHARALMAVGGAERLWARREAAFNILVQ